MMSQESRRLAGILLVVLPTVEYGGYFLLTQLITPGSGYIENPLRPEPVSSRTCTCRSAALSIVGSIALCGRGELVRRLEALREVSHSFRSNLSSRSLFLLGALAECNRAKRIHLPGICGCCDSREWAAHFGYRVDKKAACALGLNSACACPDSGAELPCFPAPGGHLWAKN
jgi:hypothetical protein